MRPPDRASLPVLLLVVACSASGPETWSGDLIGTNNPGLCDRAEFAEAHTVSLTFPSGPVAALRQEVSSIFEGSGTFSGGETVAKPCDDGTIYRLEPSSVSNVALVVTYAGVANPGGAQVKFASVGAEAPLIHTKITAVGPNEDRSVPAAAITLSATSIEDARLEGTWTVSGGGSLSGNAAKGTFVLTKTP